MKIQIINGPNLNILGQRQPEIYGSETFESFLKKLRKQYSEIQIDYYQSNSEGALIDKIQSAQNTANGIIINAAAYSHTSVAIGDALAAGKIPAVEVHISNIYQREAFRHQSYTAANCKASIVGMGLFGYKAALNFLIDLSS
jgi:3-dehydroquinate dehydratase II